jgi:hypothetical protein
MVAAVFVVLSFAQNFLRALWYIFYDTAAKEAHVDDAFSEQRLLLDAQNMAPAHSVCLE